MSEERDKLPLIFLTPLSDVLDSAKRQILKDGDIELYEVNFKELKPEEFMKRVPGVIVSGSAQEAVAFPLPLAIARVQFEKHETQPCPEFPAACILGRSSVRCPACIGEDKEKARRNGGHGVEGTPSDGRRHGRHLIPIAYAQLGHH